MTAPKKPTKTLAAPNAPPLDLTPAEMSLLRAFRAMDDRAQVFIGRLAAKQADGNPRRAVPALTLVVGGAA